MNRNVIIIGAGGHGKVVADIVLLSGDKILGFLDDDCSKKEFIGFPVLGIVGEYSKYPDAEFVVAIGNNKARRRKAEQIAGSKLYTAVHPTSVISKIDTEIGEGTVVMPNAVVNAGTHIGKHCVVNSGAIMEHDDRIGDFSHISVGAKLGGMVNIGENCWIGIGANVRNVISVCDNAVIGCGACVVENITEAGTYVGIPARRLK